MLLSYFFPNDLIVIFLKYNSDFYWGKKNTFRKSMWAQEIRLGQPRIRTPQPVLGTTSSYSVSHPNIWSDCSSSQPAKRKLRASTLKMNGHRTNYTLFHFFFQLFLRIMEGECSQGFSPKCISGEEILFLTLFGQIQ